MEKWGLGPADLEAINPELVLTRLSGYGQTGPYASRCMAGSLRRDDAIRAVPIQIKRAQAGLRVGVRGVRRFPPYQRLR